jgi:hypoxanthine phosphoribosyltransferase
VKFRVKVVSVSWGELEEMCRLLSLRIRRSRYKPDCIIGIARGGWVPARLLSDFLANKHLGSMRVEFYVRAGVRLPRPVIRQKPSISVKGKRVLLVDDVSDSGRSLEVAKAHLARRGAREVRVATLHKKPGTVFEPDYYVGKTSAWIMYPWEKNEVKHETS